MEVEILLLLLMIRRVRLKKHIVDMIEEIYKMDK